MAGEGLGPIAPWRWLQQAAALLRAQPRALLGATSMLLAVTLSPTVVEGALAASAPGLAQVLGLALSFLLLPPVVAGYYRLLHALAQGAPLPPSAVFSVFRDGPAVRRMIIANLLLTCGALLVVSLLAWGLGGDALAQFANQVMALKPGAKQLPPLPPGVLPLVVALLLFVAAFVSVQGLANCELALGPRPPLAAIAAALRLVARHFGLLLLFYVPVSVFAFLAMLLAALVAALLGMLLPAAAAILVLVAGLLLALAMYALLLGFFYYAWRELLGDVAAPPPEPTHQIAV